MCEKQVQVLADVSEKSTFESGGERNTLVDFRLVGFGDVVIILRYVPLLYPVDDILYL